jgi:drug/metabolite transporter (DMT)-like permease
MTVRGATHTGNRLDWLLFVLLGFMWGSSYLFIKIGVDGGLQPFTLVTFRLLIGAAVLGAVVVTAREQLPRGWRAYAALIGLGFFGIALPFCLITWAEGSVDSSLAAVLTAPVPLFVIPIAAVFLPEEGMTANKVVGVVVGLIGVVILVGFDVSQLGQGNLFAELVLLCAATSYAVGAVYARRFVRGYRPMIPAFFEVLSALIMVGILALVFERPYAAPLTFDTVMAVTWLGLFGSGLAFMFNFRLLNHWGAARTSLVAYLLPVWGILLGASVLGEHISDRVLIGTALVISGIALVNLRRAALAAAIDRYQARRSSRAGLAGSLEAVELPAEPEPH